CMFTGHHSRNTRVRWPQLYAKIANSIDQAVCYLGMQELAFRGHDELADSHNRGNYVELLYLLAQKDERLNNHLQTLTVSSRTSNDIQNDLIKAISSLLLLS
ncbi:hypothetical protein ILUMI_16983, partial [Ignelater luminosus]